MQIKVLLVRNLLNKCEYKLDTIKRSIEVKQYT